MCLSATSSIGTGCVALCEVTVKRRHQPASGGWNGRRIHSIANGYISSLFHSMQAIHQRGRGRVCTPPPLHPYTHDAIIRDVMYNTHSTHSPRCQKIVDVHKLNAKRTRHIRDPIVQFKWKFCVTTGFHRVDPSISIPGQSQSHLMDYVFGTVQSSQRTVATVATGPARTDKVPSGIQNIRTIRIIS